MFCQECGSKPATLHFTKIVQGEITEFHLCESCAREKGEMIPGTANGFSIHQLLSGLLDFDMHGAGPGSAKKVLGQKPQSLRCETCGLTYSQFGKMGRFGCSDCYRHFAPRLEPIFRRIHGNTRHAGKIPKRGGGRIHLKRQLEEYRQKLQEAIEREEFEEAARLRDRIRELERRA